MMRSVTAPGWAPSLPRTFVGLLRRLDPALAMRWSDEGFWVVVRHVKRMASLGKPWGVPLSFVHVSHVPVLCIQDEQGKYREPGQRDIEALQASDKWEQGKKSRAKLMAEHKAALRDAKEREKKKDHDDVQDMVRDGADTVLKHRRTRAVGAGGTF